jgi:maltose-binding protein MalE
MKTTKIALFLILTISIMSCNSSEKLVEEASKTSTVKNEKTPNKKSTDSTIAKDTPIHLSESYGSVCCPKDPKHNNHISKFIKGFEQENKVDITVYFVRQGKEGEATYFINLDNLNEKQQYQFMMQRLNIDYDVASKKLALPMPLYKLVPEGLKVERL